MTRHTSRPVAPAAQAAHAASISDRSEHSATQGLLGARGPARMDPKARLAELAALLAEGFRRQLENAPNRLASGCHVEPGCESGAFDALENTEHAA